MKRLIATDFDGTFIRRGAIDPGYDTAIRAFRAAGGLFGFVTGRGTDFFRTAEEYGVTADFFCLYNGSLLALPDGTPVKEYRIPRATFAELEAFFADSPEVCSFDRATDAPDYPHYYARYGTPELALAAAEEVNRLYGDRVTAFVNGEHVNIGKKGSRKTQGVRDALAYFGLKEENAAVFGDDFNDLDMIVSLNGWAVASARPEVLAKAPHVCESVSAQADVFLSENHWRKL